MGISGSVIYSFMDWRHLDTERSRRLKVDDELEFGRLQHRQVGGLRAFEDAIDVAGPAPNTILASCQEAFSFSRTSEIWKGFTSVTARSRRGRTEKRPRSKPPEEARFDQGRLAIASTAVPKAQQPSRTVVIFDECDLTWLKL